MSLRPVICWFRNDLRLADNHALAAALERGAPVLCLYILDDVTPGRWVIGGASRWWLHHSLTALESDLEARGGKLILRVGDTREVLPAFAAECNAEGVFCSRAYEPFAAALENDLKERFAVERIEFKRYGGALLMEPEEVRTKTGEPYKVYTPFWRQLSCLIRPVVLRPAPSRFPAVAHIPSSVPLASVALLPAKIDWASGLRAEWQPGEAAAAARLDSFLETAIADYAESRNRPDLAMTSRLSPHLHFGEIAPGRLWRRAVETAAGRNDADKGCEIFLKELVWREFSYALLAQRPDLAERPFRPEFEAFPWRCDESGYDAWCLGRTGFPIVDAGMRELWQTGYMHNRVRMIAASFLVKDLLVRWQAGAAWFWDTLVDADLASNAASWQWVAGSGADAAPYFRIFNPVTQGMKFDPEGSYVRRYVPELEALPDACIHAPWMASEEVLARAGVVIGKSYPSPIVDHAAARARALEAYNAVKRAIV